MRLFLISLLIVAGSKSSTAIAQPSVPQRPAALNVLLITGGCCHDYERQKSLLAEGISARAHTQWTIVHEGGNRTNHRLSIHDNASWADGFDVVVHNECFAFQKDIDFIHRITDAHKAGVPAVLIHCAMHCYRGPTKEWFKFCGVTSHDHGRKNPITIESIATDHPIMRRLPRTWTTPRGELYNVSHIWDTATPLATGSTVDSDDSSVCVWTNDYGKSRIFATTVGHHNETIKQAEYLDLLARGLLWACEKLGPDGRPLPGYDGTGVKPPTQAP